MYSSLARSVIRGLLQMALGAAAAGLGAALLAAFPVDVCRERRWQVGPAVVLAVSALLLVPAVRFPAIRLALVTCAVMLAGLATWILYIGSALGCE